MVILIGRKIDIEENIMSYYKNIFNHDTNFTLNNYVKRSIPSLTTHVDKAFLTRKHIPDKIKNVIFNMDYHTLKFCFGVWRTREGKILKNKKY